jgi:catechol 2,3-dioxygenase-like lactoylglutathione lyase family enzyme
MHIDSIDHLVLTVGNIHATVFFYTRALAMEEVISGDGRVALHFGGQKINLHPTDEAINPRAGNPQPGSADLCFLTTTPLDAVIRHLQNQGVPIIEGPVRRNGAAGPLSSIYIRDPDGNLIEVANLLTE